MRGLCGLGEVVAMNTPSPFWRAEPPLPAREPPGEGARQDGR